MHEELVSRMEDTLQMDVQNISSQESLQHVLTAGLQAKIQETKEKIQVSLYYSLCSDFSLKLSG